ncbi:MAG: ATP-binding cassette domain-containing protein [Chthoniobacterales bacterium]
MPVSEASPRRAIARKFFPPKGQKFPGTKNTKCDSGAARILGIDSLLDRKPNVLAGGRRQSVAVGRAILRQPKVFLFDEPLSNLAAKMPAQMRTQIPEPHHGSRQR